MTLKVLHVGSTAGIGGYLAKFMEKYHDVDSLVMIRSEYDPYNLLTKYVKSLDCNFKEFFIRCWIRSLFYDIIHIHGDNKVLKLFKMTLPYKKLIIHYHGSDIRGKWKDDRWKYADKIIVSTPDLLEGSPEGTEYLPNVIDEKLCALYKRREKEKDSCFHVYNEANDKAIDYFYRNGVRVIIHYPESNPLNHFDFLDKLSSYEYYIDVKRREGKILEAMSLTGLEALFMGVKVIRWDGALISEFPFQHRSINVCSKLKGIYEDLMK